MTTPMTPPADAVARLTKLADDYASRGDFATEDDIHALIAAYADAARDRERMREAVASWYRDARSYAVTDEELAMLNSCEANTMACLDAARTGEAR